MIVVLIGSGDGLETPAGMLVQLSGLVSCHFVDALDCVVPWLNLLSSSLISGSIFVCAGVDHKTCSFETSSLIPFISDLMRGMLEAVFGTKTVPMSYDWMRQATATTGFGCYCSVVCCASRASLLARGQLISRRGENRVWLEE